MRFEEECRETRWRYLLDSIVQDIRHGVRLLMKSPAFTAVAVLSLGLGIGANTAIFSVIDSLMLRQLPVRDPRALVMPVVSDGGEVSSNFSYPAFQRLRNASALFADAAAVGHVDVYNVTVKGPRTQPNLETDAGILRVGVVSENYFSMLGVNAVHQR